MMKHFKNILFVSQGLTDDKESLEQAMRVALVSEAKLSALIVTPELPAGMATYREVHEHSLHRTLQEKVQLIQQELQLPPQELPTVIISSDKPAVTIIQYILTHHHDLLIKDAEEYGESSIGFRAIDMTLLRKCPCPVWLNRPNIKPKKNRRVAVAIDPNCHTAEQKALALRLLELSRAIVDSCDSRLHILSCWEYELENYLRNNVWIKVDDDDLNAQIEEARVTHRAALDLLIADSGIEGDLIIHHQHGTPDKEIPACVTHLNIDVLVMGTLARTGIQGFVMGNTAENILKGIDCALVALKPTGFISPIS
ncbi:universal stress protein [Aeromonas australiensis]|uniref:universal stress protein n=1 Tax=Aeromonas australiensis TaxID=1114880 RepID=UPI000A3E644D|nr:universal stress protein [Aeromonas australiensis]